MAITPMSDNLNIVAALADTPNDADGLTAAQLKAKFDEAGNTIKDYINDSLIPDIAQAISDAEMYNGNVPGGGATGQALIKASGTDYDAAWSGGTSAATPSTVMGRDASGNVSVATPTAEDHAANKEYVDAISPRVGDIKFSQRNDLGSKWALCNMALVDEATYPDLYAAMPITEDIWKIVDIESASVTLFDMTYANGVYVACGTDASGYPSIWYSASLTGTWTKVNIVASAGSVKAIRWIGDMFVAAGISGTAAVALWYGADPAAASTWTAKTVVASAYTQSPVKYAYINNTHIVSYCTSGDNYAAIASCATINGTYTLKTIANGSASDTTLQPVRLFQGFYWMPDYANVNTGIKYSSDLNTWSAVTIAANPNYIQLGYAPSLATEDRIFFGNYTCPVGLDARVPTNWTYFGDALAACGITANTIAGRGAYEYGVYTVMTYTGYVAYTTDFVTFTMLTGVNGTGTYNTVTTPKMVRLGEFLVCGVGSAGVLAYCRRTLGKFLPLITAQSAYAYVKVLP